MRGKRAAAVSAITAGVVCASASVAASAGAPARSEFVLLTAMVAFARIYNGRHLALDVIGGAGLGVMSGSLAGLVGTDGPTPGGAEDAL